MEKSDTSIQVSLVDENLNDSCKNTIENKVLKYYLESEQYHLNNNNDGDKFEEFEK